MKTFKINWPIVIIVTILCGASLVLFFLWQERQSNVLQPVVDTVADEEPFVEQDYYSQLADEFLVTLPEDKRVIATLIDDTNHHILYYESSAQPSCYLYDLESLTTSVLFGGENGFYCDTKLLMIGTIRDWMRSGDWIVFVASNRAPEADYPASVIVFSLNVYTHGLRYIDTGSDAFFDEGKILTVKKAVPLFRSFFTGEEIYSETSVQYELEQSI